ncbi:MAG: bifunctional phosphoribosylaminoimidazolecarboxamide formyltransferase/IMP cyclohydrolase [Flavobacteriaceae bacterium]|nr:bifunctional phosphoribosylaminoimidazolecarboxamide formyltransferase/IMP cyclohydrolase [Flavobacteriaceae bacterium]MCY4268345.1 bifunctional phosphoribosylaminoimidazolecarboxamide formyltransferase/IMP cyclohydrolase [Flavobacteriaceae bacterium]MCY4298283.1 bifunctional phosphoribosylaminoimidazolecarboxamide formyltransferase/IMP cyclohydrolase [Flavobacteriaceae bacterium]
MNQYNRKIKRALISVYEKKGLDQLVKTLVDLDVELYSTGGTYRYIKDIGIQVRSIEELTTYPSILGGRVKTLHPKVFGGILSRSDSSEDLQDVKKYQINLFDLVVVDLYPFDQTFGNQNATHDDLIEKIDIGGVSLIRAAAKNYSDVLCVSNRNQYSDIVQLLKSQKGKSTLDERKSFAYQAFLHTHQYDGLIAKYYSLDQDPFQKRIKPLRYGENPHQKAEFQGDLSQVIEQLHGKDISYNNLLDIEAALWLILEFDETKNVFAIFKHNNACGISQSESISQSFQKALQADPLSAFGGVLISNQTLDLETAKRIRPIFVEVVIAKNYQPEALALLKEKKNIIILKNKATQLPKNQWRSCLNGVLKQEFNQKTDGEKDLKVVTSMAPNSNQIEDLLFASKISKHTKSNAIVLVKNQQLLASGMGQTSRVDALNHAIAKAKTHQLDLNDSVMASEAFFPFPDCVEIAHQQGIQAIIQPGGSKKDQLSIDYCNQHQLAMVFSGTRHFKH